MILTEVKDYVRERGQVSLGEVALHFDVDLDTARGWLDFWLRKGRLRRLAADEVCGSSCSCVQKPGLDLYEWNPSLGAIPIVMD